MKKLLFTGLMSLSIGILSASYGSSSCTESCCPPCNRFNVDVDFLWWDAHVENTSTRVGLQPEANTPSVRTYYPVDYNWRPGYRIELGYATCLCDRTVDLFAKWTWYRTNTGLDLAFTLDADDTLTIRDPILGLSTISGNGVEAIYGNSSSFLFERLDVGLMSDSLCLGFFTFKPLLSATFVYAQGKYGAALDANTTTPLNLLASGTGKFSGGGLTIGANVTFPLMQSLFIYSVSELTGLWGKIDRTSDGLINSTISPLDFDGETKFWGGRAILRQELGLGYNAPVCSFPVSVHIGWEFMYLPNFNMIATLPGDGSFGVPIFDDMTINGLVAGIAVGF